MISLLECGDGKWVFVHTMARGAFDRLMAIIGREDLADPSNTDLFAQMEPGTAEQMWVDVRRTFASATAQHWFETLSAADIPCMVANPAGRALLIEQYTTNGLTARRSDGLLEMGAVAKFERTPLHLHLDTPEPGTTSLASVASEVGLVGPQRRRVPGGTSAQPEQAATVRGPLDGLLVVDFGIFLAGPSSPRLMADLGARVIKVEETSGDPFRGPNRGFLACARGKESLAIDLKTSQGRDLVYRLVERADVVHRTCASPPSIALELTRASRTPVNPRLMLVILGIRQRWTMVPSPDVRAGLHSASAGVLHRTGGEGNPPLTYLSNMDLGCGFTSTICVLAALIERERSGKGQYVEVPQSGAGLLAMSDAYLVGDEVHQTYSLDQAQRGHALTRALYPTRDGWVLVSVVRRHRMGWSQARLDDCRGGLSTLPPSALHEARTRRGTEHCLTEPSVPCRP